jgi:hypothetical protein
MQPSGSVNEFMYALLMQNLVAAVCAPLQAEPHPAERSPSDSYFSITYPFTTNRALRDQVTRAECLLRVVLV